MTKLTKHKPAQPAAVKHQQLLVPLKSLHRHPKNYRSHPADQLEHIMQSIREHGIYRNIVVAKDRTILAGHGVAEAAEKLGITKVPVVQLDLDANDTRALKLLAGDNEISNLGEVDDRALSELLRSIKIEDTEFGLLGTGFDDKVLANLVMVTRPASEIEDFDAAAEWAGLTEYEEGGDRPRLIITFDTVRKRERFLRRIGYTKRFPNSNIKRRTVSFRMPFEERTDFQSVKLVPKSETSE